MYLCPRVYMCVHVYVYLYMYTHVMCTCLCLNPAIVKALIRFLFPHAFTHLKHNKLFLSTDEVNLLKQLTWASALMTSPPTPGSILREVFMFNDFGKTVLVNESLVDPHLEMIPCFGTFTTRCFSCGESRCLGRHVHQSFHFQILLPHMFSQVGTQLLRRLHIATYECDSNLVNCHLGFHHLSGIFKRHGCGQLLTNLFLSRWVSMGADRAELHCARHCVSESNNCFLKHSSQHFHPEDRNLLSILQAGYASLHFKYVRS